MTVAYQRNHKHTQVKLESVNARLLKWVIRMHQRFVGKQSFQRADIFRLR